MLVKSSFGNVYGRVLKKNFRKNITEIFWKKKLRKEISRKIKETSLETFGKMDFVSVTVWIQEENIIYISQAAPKGVYFPHLFQLKQKCMFLLCSLSYWFPFRASFVSPAFGNFAREMCLLCFSVLVFFFILYSRNRNKTFHWFALPFKNI